MVDIVKSFGQKQKSNLQYFDILLIVLCNLVSIKIIIIIIIIIIIFIMIIIYYYYYYLFKIGYPYTKLIQSLLLSISKIIINVIGVHSTSVTIEILNLSLTFKSSQIFYM